MITGKVDTEVAKAVADAFFTLYEVDDTDEKPEAYDAIVEYARSGCLYVEDGAILWDPDGQLGGPVKFQEADGFALAKAFETRPKDPQDLGMVKICAAITGTSVNKLRKLKLRHARMVHRFAVVLI